LYLGRFSDVHIGGPSSNQATSLESQMIHPTQLLPGRTLKSGSKFAAERHVTLFVIPRLRIRSHCAPPAEALKFIFYPFFALVGIARHKRLPRQVMAV
jgi:hypothetical protein